MVQPLIAPERMQMRIHFDTICAESLLWTEQTAKTRESLSRRMERNCFEVVIANCKLDGIDRLFTEKKFVERYSAICSKVLANLDPSGSIGSTYLIERVILGEIDPYKIAELNSYELCPEASKIEREGIALRLKQKANGKVSYMDVCRKCGKNETLRLEYQGRAIDEGSSHSIKCVNCDFVWRK